MAKNIYKKGIIMQKNKNANAKNNVTIKHVLNRIICLVCILTMINGSFIAQQGFAYTDEQNISVKSTSDFLNISNPHPLGTIEDLVSDGINMKPVCLKDADEDILVSNVPEVLEMPGKPELEDELSAFNIAPYAATYTYADLNKMTYEEVVNTIITLGWRNAVTDSYTYNNGSVEFFSDANRRKALFDAIVERGATYTANDRKAVDDLIIIIRAAWYLSTRDIANNQLAFLNQQNYKREALPAIKAIINNPNFKPGIQNNILYELGNLIWGTTVDIESVNATIPFIQAYIDDVDDVDNWFEYSDDGKRVPHGTGNPTPWGGNGAKANAFYNIINPIHNVLSNIQDINSWRGNIDGFIEKIEDLTYYDAQTKVFSLSVENCMWWMQVFGKLHTNNKEALRVLTEAMKRQPYAEVLWHRAASIITGWLNENYDFDGKLMPNASQQKEIGIATLLSEKYMFDDGKIVIYAGNRVSSEAVERLYWAAKEVSAQYFRGVGSTEPIDGYNRPDDVLTCYIYNDLFEYQANKFIFGTSIENGGIYIESWGSFFTFDRAPGTNLYMLEELFRHEFTHYLQAKYVVPNYFGEGPLHQNKRIDWIQEGGAEWHAGSTRTDGVVPRASIINDLKQFPKDSWYSLSKTLSTGYEDGWDFYTYGCTLYSLMFTEKMEMYYEITDAMQNGRNDANEFDRVISKYKSDTPLNVRYQSHMDYLVANLDNYYIPQVADDYLDNHNVKKTDDIIADIKLFIDFNDVEIIVLHSSEFNTIELSGKYTIPNYKSRGRVLDHEKIAEIADNALIELDKKDWSGYKTFVNYYTDYAVNANNDVEFKVTFHGILTDNDPTMTNKPPVVKVNGPFDVSEIKGGTKIEFSSEGTTDDGGLEKLTYHWDFGDGETSTDANPTHIYMEANRFDVKLTVTDEHGLESSANTYVNIKGEFIRSEDEDNYSFEEANGPVGNNLSVKGVLSSNDVDTFYFNVLKTGDFEITLTGEDGNPFIATVLVYGPDSDTVSKGWFGEGVGNFKGLTPGKYYIRFWAAAGTVPGKYTLLVKGDGDVNTGITEETEPNNSRDKANGPISNDVNVVGNLKDMNGNSNSDWFYFDVIAPGKVDITVTSTNGLNLTWGVFKEQENTYITWPKTTTGGQYKGDFIAAEPARYYISVWFSPSSAAEYTINITGPIK